MHKELYKALRGDREEECGAALRKPSLGGENCSIFTRQFESNMMSNKVLAWRVRVGS